jgi:hypothetical protein
MATSPWRKTKQVKRMSTTWSRVQSAPVGSIRRKPADTFWDGYASSANDFDSPVWEIAQNPFSPWTKAVSGFEISFL